MKICQSANRGKARIRVALVAILLSISAIAVAFALAYESGWPRSIGDAVYSSPAVEDIDGSGKKIVVSTYDGYTHVIGANGVEASGWPAITGSIRKPRSPAIADLDGDGKKEVVISSDWSSAHKPKGFLSVFRANGSLTWSYAFPDFITVESSPVVADLTGEGEPEIIVGTVDTSSTSNSLYIFHQNQTIYKTIALSGKMYATPAVADLDKDGDIELLVATTDGSLALYDANGLQMWSISIGAEYSSPAIGDIDFDGTLEIVVGAVNGLYVLDKNGQALSGWPNTNIKKASSPALGDLDGDGDLEIAVGTYASGPNNKVFALQGNGEVIAGWPYQLSYTPLDKEYVDSSPAIADIDGDGEVEVVVATFATGGPVGSRLIVFDKGGTVESSVALGGLYAGPISSSPSISDVDGDGRVEIAVGAADGKLHLLDGGGMGYVGWPMFHNNPRRTGAYEQPLLRVLSPSNGSIFNQNDGIQLSAQARTLSGGVPTYSWTSNRDGIIGNSSNFTKVGLTVGTHAITVTASDATGSTSYQRSIQVLNSPPTVSVSSPANGSKFETNQPVSLSCTGSDPYGSIAKYEWDFEGDGVYDYSSATSGSTSRSYAQSGSYAARCRATDNDGGVAAADVLLKINAPPTASISLPPNNSIFTVGDAISLVGVASDSDGSIALYEWDFESDGIYDYNSTMFGNTTHTYTTAGSRTARFRATDNDGSSATAQVSLRINDPPIAMINLPLNGNEFKFGRPISFEGSAFDSDGTIAAYLWNSSLDGVLSTSASFNRSNLSIGAHVITFTATDNNGARDSDSVSITIKPINAPTANITQPLDGSEFSANDVVSFVGTGSDIDGVVVVYNWTSSIDGALNTSATFNTSSLSVGDHLIALTVTDDDGLTGSSSIHVEVKKRAVVAPPGGGGGGPPPGIPPVERIKSAQDLIAGNRGFFSTSELYVAPPQLAGVLGSLGFVPVPKDEAKAINRITGGRVRTLQGDPYEIAGELLLRKHVQLERAIVSRGDVQVDSLAGLVYARHLGIPILVVEPNNIPMAIKRALSTLGVSSTVVLGGPVAVSNAVADELRQMERIAGGDRYETAVRLAEALMSRRTIDIVVITDGASPNADAVVAAILYNAPILYSKGDDIPLVTMEFLRRNKSLNIKAVGITDAAFTKLSGLLSGR